MSLKDLPQALINDVAKLLQKDQERRERVYKSVLKEYNVGDIEDLDSGSKKVLLAKVERAVAKEEELEIADKDSEEDLEECEDGEEKLEEEDEVSKDADPGQQKPEEVVQEEDEESELEEDAAEGSEDIVKDADPGQQKPEEVVQEEEESEEDAEDKPLEENGYASEDGEKQAEREYQDVDEIFRRTCKNFLKEASQVDAENAAESRLRVQIQELVRAINDKINAAERVTTKNSYAISFIKVCKAAREALLKY